MAPRALSLRRTTILLGLLSLVVLGLVAWSIVRSIAATPPKWWRTVNPKDPATIALADEIQNTLITELHKTDHSTANIDPGPGDGGPGDQGGDDTWSIIITPAQANAWLNVKFPGWLGSREGGFRWPEEIKELQVGFEPGVVRVAVEATIAGSRQYLTVSLSPRSDESGALWVDNVSFALGRLALPAGEAVARASRHAQGSEKWSLVAADVLKAVEGEAPLVEEPLIRLSDGRTVRIVKIEAYDNALVATLETIAPR